MQYLKTANDTRTSAHRVILSATSDYFRAMFNNSVKEAKDKEIVLHEVDTEALQTLITYMYTGKSYF